MTGQGIDGLNITFYLKLMVGLVKGEYIVVTTASEEVGTVVTSLLGGNPVAGADFGVTIGGTIAVIGIENAPVAVQTIAKNEVHRAINCCGVRINAVTIVGHLNTGARIPVSEGDVTNNVHCSIGIEANECNQHGEN